MFLIVMMLNEIIKRMCLLLLLVPDIHAQCTSDECGEPGDNVTVQIKILMVKMERLAQDNERLHNDNKRMSSKMLSLETNNKQLSDKVRALESDNERLSSRVTFLESNAQNLSMNVSVVGNSQEIISSTVRFLENNQQSISSKITSLEASQQSTSLKVTYLETSDQQLTLSAESIRTAIGRLQMTVDRLQVNVTQLPQASAVTTESSSVYFFAVANKTENYADGDVVKFHDTRANVVPTGSTGGWDAVTNTFTCPVTGHYTFAVTLFKQRDMDPNNYRIHTSGQNFGASIVQTYHFGTDTEISSGGAIRTFGINDKAYYLSTGWATVPCAAGETVWVKADCANSCLTDGKPQWNMFTGIML